MSVPRKDLRLKSAIYNKLKQQGIDVDFLVWLEGREDRLPRVENILKVKPGDYAVSIVTAVWLAQFFAHPEIIAPSKPSEWSSRYKILQQFLINALRQSLSTRRKHRARDLALLEATLKALLPESACTQYAKDIRALRKSREPKSFEDAIQRHRGGKRESEETSRMRAAIEHLKTKSNRKWQDLAELWNERRGGMYQPDELSSRLRKGPRDEAEKGAGALVFWRDIYRGDFTAIFGGRFPLSPKLEEIVNRTRA